jgi:nucleoside-diphosphate-sugar epimerase
VIALTRQPEQALHGCEARFFSLGEVVAPDALANVDVLVHAAYDFSCRSWADICRVNVIGSEYLFDAATRARVKRQIFISSMAAFEGCRSYYGLSKLVTEHAAQIRSGFVVRPGLIYSEQNGGLAAKITKLAQTLPLMPMIGSGQYPLYTCHLEDLCNLVIEIAQMEQPPRSIITAANASPITLRALAKNANGGSAPPFIFPIPWRLIAAGLWLAERLGLRLDFCSDSVVSLVHAIKAPDFTTVQNMHGSFRPWGIAEVAQACCG